MTTPKRPKPAKAARKTTRNGRRIVAGLRSLVATLDVGGMAAVATKFTTTKPTADVLATATVAEVADIRRAIGVAPPTFAAFLGVDSETLREWERGRGTLSGPAARFLAEIRRDPEYWKSRLASGSPTATRSEA